jgi:hypothetical protein
MSGNRRPARLKRRPWRLNQENDGFDRPIDRYGGKFQWQRRRRGGQRVPHRRHSHADRAEIVSMAVVVSALLPAVVGRGNGRRCGNPAPGSLAADRVEVTKGQPKVYRQRNQRQPCTLPDRAPKPAHSSDNVPRLSAEMRSYLSHRIRQLYVRDHVVSVRRWRGGRRTRSTSPGHALVRFRAHISLSPLRTACDHNFPTVSQYRECC